MQGLYTCRNEDGLFASRRAALHPRYRSAARTTTCRRGPTEVRRRAQSRDRARALRHRPIGACRDFRQTKAHLFGFVQPADCAANDPMRSEGSVHAHGRSNPDTSFDLGTANCAAEPITPAAMSKVRRA